MENTNSAVASQASKSITVRMGGKKMTYTFRPRRALSALLSALVASISGHAFALDADALPTGGNITAGTGSISQAGANMQINQATQSLVVNWNTFNIGTAASVNFAQPNAQAVALNRVITTDASQIFGKLTSNGQVFLINPNGVLFGASAKVDVGGLVASTLDISDADFLAGRMVFGNGGSSGSVVNLGEIKAADGGYVALLAPQVRNEGVIVARLGTIALASGNKVTLDAAGDGLIKVTVNEAAVNALAANKGLIQADGGIVYMGAKGSGDLMATVVNNEGIIEARGLVERDGKITLVGGDVGAVVNSGTLNAQGGEIAVSGNYVGNTGTISANDAGKISIDSLQKTVMMSTSVIEAKGGGEVRINQPGAEGFTGARANTSSVMYAGALIDTTGGADNGFVEVSGAHLNVDAGTIKAGHILFDPLNITFSNGVDVNVTGFTPPGDLTEAFADNAGLNSNFRVDGAGILNTVLASSTIIFEATNDITVTDAFNLNTATTVANVSLVLTANNNINVNAAVTADGTGVINMTADADASGLGNLNVNANLTTGGGLVILRGENVNLAGAAVSTSSGNYTVIADFNGNGAGQYTQNAASSVTTSNGTIDITVGDGATISSALNAGAGAGAVNITATSGTVAIAGAITSGSGGVTVDPPQTLNITGNINTSGNIDLRATDSITINATDIRTTGAATTIDISANHGVADGIGDLTIGSTATTTIRANGSGAITLSAEGITIGNDGFTSTITAANGGNVDINVDRNAGNDSSATIGVDTIIQTNAGGSLLIDGGQNLIINDPLSNWGIDGNLTIGGVDPVTGTLTMNADITGVGGNISMSSDSNLTVDGDLTTTNGAITLRAGVGGAGTLTIAQSASLTITAGGAQNINLEGDAVNVAINSVGGFTASFDATGNTINVDGAAIQIDAARTSLAMANFTVGATARPTTLIISDTAGANTITATDLNSASSTVTLNAAAGGITQNTAIDLTGKTLVMNTTLLGDIVLANINAATLTATATGTLTDAAATTLAVTGLATFGGTTITLGDNGADSTNFGTLTFTSAGAVSISEDTATQLDGASTAGSLTLTSAAAITNTATADLAVTGLGTLIGTGITLGENVGNVVDFGTLTFTSAGAVAISEDSATDVAGANTASTLGLTSSGTITALAGSTIISTAAQTYTAGGDIAFLGGAGSVSSGNAATVTLQTVAVGASIGVGNGSAGTLQIDSTDIAALGDELFTDILIGRADGTHVIDVQAVTFLDPVTIRTPNVGGSITVNGQITGNGDASITLDGSGATTTLNADIVTAGNFITISDAVLLGTPALITLDTTNGGGSPAGNNITVTGTINDDVAGSSALVLRAGTTGNVDLQGAVGGTARIAQLGVSSSLTTTLVNVATTSHIGIAATTINLAGTSYTANDGNIDLLGAVALTGAGTVTINSDANADLTAGDVNISGAVTDPGSNSALTITASTNASVTLGGNVLVNGALDVTGFTINLAGTSYQTNDGNIDLRGPVELTGAGTVTIASDADADATDGSINLTGAVSDATANSALTINADTAQVDVANITVNGAISVTGGNINLNGGTITSTTAAIAFIGSVDLDAAAGNITVTSGGGAGDSISFSSTIADANNNNVLVVNAGAVNNTTNTVTFGGNVGTAPNQLGGLTVTTGAGVSLNGNISAVATGGQSGAVDFTAATGGTTLLSSSTVTGTSVDFLNSNVTDGAGSFNFIVNATAGNARIDGGDIDGYLSVTATGNVTIDAGTGWTVSGANAGTAIKLNTILGNVTVNGQLTADGVNTDISIDPVDVAINAAITATSDVLITADNNIDVAAVTVRADSDADGNGTLIIAADNDAAGGGNLVAVNGSLLRGASVSLQGNNVTVDLVTAHTTTIGITGAVDVNLNDTVNAATNITVQATTGTLLQAVGGDMLAGGNVALDGVIAVTLNGTVGSGAAIGGNVAINQNGALADGTVTINGAVTGNQAVTIDGTTVTLAANIIGDNNVAGTEDVDIGATVAINQTAGFINSNSGGVILAGGTVTLRDVRSAGGNQIATGGGTIGGANTVAISVTGTTVTMTDITADNIQSTGGDVEVTATAGNILLGDVRAPAMTVFLQASDSITDNNAALRNVEAATLTAQAANLIGLVHADQVYRDTEDTGYAGNALETSVATLNLATTALDSDIAIDNTDSGAGLTVATLDAGGANAASAWIRNSAALDVSALGAALSSNGADRLGFIATTGNLTVADVALNVGAGAGTLKLEANGLGGDVLRLAAAGTALDVTAANFVLKSGVSETVTTQVTNLDATLTGVGAVLIVTESVVGGALILTDLDGDNNAVKTNAGALTINVFDHNSILTVDGSTVPGTTPDFVVNAGGASVTLAVTNSGVNSTTGTGSVTIENGASVTTSAGDSDFGTMLVNGRVQIDGGAHATTGHTLTLRGPSGTIAIGASGVTGSGALTLDAGSTAAGDGFNVTVAAGATVLVNAGGGLPGNLIIQNTDNVTMGANSTLRTDGGISITARSHVILANIDMDDDGDGLAPGAATLSVTVGGSITTLAGSTISSNTGNNISLTANGVAAGGAGNITLNGLIQAGGAGTTTTLTSTNAYLVDGNAGGQNIATAGTLDLNAGLGIGYDGTTNNALEIDALILSADVTNAGRINLTNGPSGDVTVTSLSLGGAGAGNTIAYTQTSGNLLLQNGVGVNDGTVIVSNGGNVDVVMTTGGGNITVNDDILSGGGNITIDPPVDVTVAADIDGAGGDVLVEALNNINITTGSVFTNGAGVIRIIADQDASGAGDLTVTAVGVNGTEKVRTAGGAITLEGENITLTDYSVDAGAGTVTLLAGRRLTSVGDIIGNGDATVDIEGAVIDLTAKGGAIGATLLAVDATTRLNAKADGAITLQDVAGAMPVGLIDAGANLVTLTAAGNVTDADADAAVDVRGTTLTITATAGSIDLDTDVTTFTTTNAGGTVSIDDISAINLTTVTTAGSAITVEADGDITVTTVTAGGGTTVTLRALTAGADILDDGTDAAAITGGTVDLTAANTIVLDGNGDANAGDATIAAATINAVTTGGTGTITLVADNAGAVNFNNVVAATGAISLRGYTGALTLTNVVTNGGSNTDDVTVNSNGQDVTVGVVTASSLGDVSITAANLIDDANDATRITANQLTLVIGAGAIGAADEIDLAVDEILSITGAQVNLGELNAVTVTSIAATGQVDLVAGGIVTLANSGIAAGANTVNVTGSAINGTGNDGTAEITSGALNLVATNGGIGATTQVEITASGVVNATSSTASGNIDIQSTGALSLGHFNAGSGDINLVSGAISDGNVAANNLTGNDVTLTVTGTVGALADMLETSIDTLVVNAGATTVGIENNKALVVTNINGATGQVDITTTTGTLTATQLTVTNADLNLTSLGGSILVGNIDSGNGVITLFANQSITELGTDVAADITTSTTLNMTASNGGIGATNAIETAVAAIVFTGGAAGNVQINEADAVSVQGTTTFGSNGGITITTAAGAGNGTITVNGTLSADGSGAINLTAAGGAATTDIVINGGGVASTSGSITLLAARNITQTAVLGDTNTINTAGNVSLTATAGSITGNNNLITGAQLAASAVAGSIDIDTTVAFVTSAIALNAVTINETDAITLVNVQSTGLGDILVTAGGNLSAVSVVNANGAVTLNTNLASGGSISVGTVTATTTVNMDADAAITDGGGMITAPTIILAANTGIGAAGNAVQLVSLGTLALTADTAAGAIILNSDPTGLVTLNSMTTGDNGAIHYTQADNSLVVAGAITSVGGNITIDPPVDIDINAAITSSGGAILIEATDDIRVNAGGSIASSNGTITITADFGNSGAGDFTQVAAAGTINAGSGLVTISGVNVQIDDVQTTGNAGITATGGNITEDGDAGVDIVANALTLTATGGIGAGVANLAIDTTVASLTANSSTAGDIGINETDTITLTSVTTTSGTITVVSGDAMTASNVVAGTAGNISLSTAANGIAVGTVTAVGDTVTLNAAAAITQVLAAAGVTALNLVIDAGSTIGTTTDYLKTTVSTIAESGTDVGTANAVGDVFISNSGNLTITHLETAGNIDLTVLGSLDSTTVDAAADLIGNTVSLIAGSIGTNTLLEINATTLNSNTVAGGNQFILDTAGGVAVGLMDAGAGNITLTANNGSITSLAGDVGVADIVAGTVNLTVTGAGSDIGDIAGVNALEINATTLNAATAGAVGNDILITDTASGVAAGLVTAGLGDVTLTATGGAITSLAGDAGTADVVGATINLTADTLGTGLAALEVDATTLNTNTSGADGNQVVTDTAGGVALGQMNAAGGNVTLVATAGAITDATPAADATVNVIANALSLTAGTGSIGGAGLADLDTTVNTLTLASATGGSITLTNTVAMNVTNATATGAGVNDVTLTTLAGNLGVGTVTADDTATLTAFAAITDGNGAGTVNVAAITLAAIAGTGIELDSTVTNAGLASTAGAVTLRETNGLTLTGATTTAGDLSVTTANNGVLDVTGVVSTTGAGNVALSASGALSFTATGDVSTATGNIALTAGSGGAGGITMADDGVVATLIDAGSGRITVNSVGDVLLGRLTTTSNLDDVLNVTDAIVVTITAGNLVDGGDIGGADIQAVGGIALNVSGSIGIAVDPVLPLPANAAIDLQVGSASINAGGGVAINQVGNLVLNMNVAGDINVTVLDGTLTANNVVATGLGSDITLTTLETVEGTAIDANLIVGTVTAAGDTVTLNSADAITQQAASAGITTAGLTMTAQGGIGATGAALLTNVNTITAASTSVVGIVSTAADIVISETNAVTLTNLSVANGNIDVTAGGTLTATLVAANTAGNNVSLTANGAASDVLLGSVTANAGLATVTAGNLILDNLVGEAANVTAASIDFNAATGIGAVGDDVDLVVTNITADTTAGLINLANVPTAATVTINSMTTGDASNISYAQTGQNLTIAGAITSAGGNILIDPPVDVAINANVTTTGAGSITIQGSGAISTANGVIVSTDTGALTIEGAVAGDEAVSLTMADNSSILSNTGTITLRANTMTLDNVGSSGDVLLDSDAAAGAITTLVVGAGRVSANNLTVQQDNASLVTIATAVTSLNVVGGNTVTVTEDNDIVVNSVVTAAAGTFNLTATAGAITNDDLGATPDIVTGIANLNAVGGIDVDTTVTSLTAATTGAGGSILIDETDAITLTSVTTTDGAITVNAGGTMTASIVTAGGSGRNVALTTTAGDIAVGLITATGDTVTLNAAAAITGGNFDLTVTNITAANLVATATSGIAVDTVVSTLTATTEAGDINVRNNGALTINSATISDTLLNDSGNDHLAIATAGQVMVLGAITNNDGGNIFVAADGAVNADLIIGNNVTATGGNGAIFLVGGSGLQHAGGAVSATGAGDVTLGAGFQINYATLNPANLAIVDLVSPGGSATADLVQTSGVTVTSGTGTIGLYARDNIAVSSLSTGGNVEISANDNGGTVPLLAVNNTGAITDANGSGTLNVTANTLTATAATGISLDTTVTTLNATNTGTTGDIAIRETNGVIVTTLQQTNVANTLGTVTLTSTTGNIALNDAAVLSQGGLVTLTATAGAITDNDGGATASIVNATGAANLSAFTGIGAAAAGSAIDTTLDSLTATTATGGVYLNETNAITLTSVTTTSSGDIVVTANGLMTATNVVASSSTTTAGNGNVSLTTTTGNIAVGTVTAAADTVTLNSAAAITQGAGTGVTALALVIDSVGAIGTALNPLLTTVATIDRATGNTSDVGDIYIVETDAVELVNVIAGNGNIDITAGGTITATNVAANSAGNDVTLRANGLASDVLVNSVTAVDVVTITAGRSIEESGADGTSDISGATLDLNAATGIGTLAQIEINALTLTADTTAGAISLNNLSAGPVTSNSMTTGDASNITYNQALGTLNVNNNFTSSGGNILIDPVDVNLNGTARVGTNANGTIQILASGAINMLAGSRVTSGDGSITIGDKLGAQAVSFTMADTTRVGSDTGNITILADGMALDEVTTGGNVALTSTATGADDVITQVAGSEGLITATNLTITANATDTVNLHTQVVSLNSTGGSTVTIREDNDIQVNSVVTDVLGTTGTFNLVAGGRISKDADALVADVTAFNAFLNAGGSIDLETSVTNVGFTALGGVTLFEVAAGDDIHVVSYVSPTLVSLGESNATGNIRITTEDGNNIGDINIDADMRTTGALTTIVLDSDAQVLINNAGTNVVSVGGDITVLADTNITMVSGTSIDSTTGQIDLTAGNNVNLALVNTSATTGRVNITATAGAITDNNGNLTGDNVVADTLVMEAATGIGAGNALETSVNQMAARTTAAGASSIQVSNNKALELVDVVGTWGYAVQAAGNGSIDISTTAGALTITDHVQTVAASTGNISLVAAGAINQTTGNVTAFTTGNVTMTAQGGNLTQTSGRTVTTGSGNIGLTASDDVLLSINTTTGGIITVTAGTDGTGNISDNLNGETCNLCGGATTTASLIATGGSIGGTGTADIDLDVGTLGGAITGAGSMFIQENDNLTVTTLTTANGNINLEVGSGVAGVMNAGTLGTGTLLLGTVSAAGAGAAGGTVTIIAADDILDNNGALNNITATVAANLSALRLDIPNGLANNGGNIGTWADAIEVNVPTIAVHAGGTEAVSGYPTSVNLAGTVTDGVVHILNAVPPGMMLLNGIVINNAVPGGNLEVSGVAPEAGAAALAAAYDVMSFSGQGGLGTQRPGSLVQSMLDDLYPTFDPNNLMAGEGQGTVGLVDPLVNVISYGINLPQGVSGN
ncbi:MAG: filamentous hemagglutinin N-terminal domain-containing protein [Pseudomonadota bacterium]|nr:filamentous hemagglutinin N-terminal domain-containing protein [Pseudomonadota bacterium]